ncbi:Transcription factor HES-2 [Merluccius polli]|uniref:Transcription factor HES-2 n=1 Tax=Merluccius polli TaxID=89951 RepID=A0AA47N2M5_MERPO|nr:Transcription factor HES-2 [Merluccius polli]
MTSSVAPEASQPLPARSTVAQRKQANELRKTLKPLLEKKRRARINDSLGSLKTLILPLVGKDNARYSKLEKADILEMTVRFLRELPSSPAKSSSDSYKEGYKACLDRVSALLPRTSMDQGASQRVQQFIQQSSVTQTCRNCCAQAPVALPQIQQRLMTLKSSLGPRAEPQSPQQHQQAPSRAPPAPAAPLPMWRPCTVSPNMTCDHIHTSSPRLTVARRKEALELRKTMKPLMEKRRRARINDSLEVLKSLIIPLTGKEKSRYSKLEKADILEMTVRFLGKIPPINAKSSSDSYKEGYKACLDRVSALLPRTSMDQGASQRVQQFIQQSSVTQTCRNCCAQAPVALPQIQQRLMTLKSSLGPRAEPQSPHQSHQDQRAPSRAPPAPAAPLAMWRPW